MGYEIPDFESAGGAAKAGGMNGIPLGLGEAIGRALIGGPGTALGGLAVAAARSEEETRDELATLAIHQAMAELTGGA